MPLTERAYQSIKAAIINLVLRPGQPLVETSLAQQLHISKTPVRDALRKLEKEGLVVFYPYKGFYVAPISREDIREVYHLKSLLEGMAARVAARTLTKEQIEEAESLIEGADDAIRRGDEDACRALGDQFHRFLIAAVRNRRLEALMDNLSDHQERFFKLIFGIPGRLQRSTLEHRRVFEAIVEGDELKAEAAVHAHMESFIQEFLENEKIKEITDP